MTEQEQVQLLPCPFCGGDAKYEAEGEWQYYDVWSVECRECGASLSGNADMRVSGASAKAEAIAAWNTRHRIEATAEALEAMREAREALDHGCGYLFVDCGFEAGDEPADQMRAALTRLTSAIAKIEGEQP
jgi:Lar family restriction alleviation protein